jgi:predicted O-methyltransferase YrrM
MVTEPYSAICPDTHHLYSTIDEEAPEEEVRLLIKALVYALKPLVVVETGTAHGYTARTIAEQLVANGNGGHLHTIECDVLKASQAEITVRDLPATVWKSYACRLSPHRFGPIDLLYIDGCLEERVTELEHYWPAVTDGGLAVVHDTLKFDPPATEMAAWLFDHDGFTLRTPRGVTLVQKR